MLSAANHLNDYEVPHHVWSLEQWCILGDNLVFLCLRNMVIFWVYSDLFFLWEQRTVKLESLIFCHSGSAANSLEHTKFHIFFHFYVHNLTNFPFQGASKRWGQLSYSTKKGFVELQCSGCKKAKNAFVVLFPAFFRLSMNS